VFVVPSRFCFGFREPSCMTGRAQQLSLENQTKGVVMNKLVHWNIPTTDVGRSSKFFAELFGWRIQAWGSDYALFEVEGGVGGGFSKVAKMPAPGIEVYIEVEDIPAALKRAGELGGIPDQPKTEIFGGMGFMATFLDPCGCRIGLWSKV